MDNKDNGGAAQLGRAAVSADDFTNIMRRRLEEARRLVMMATNGRGERK